MMNPHTEPDIASHPLRLQRLGLVMEPETGNPLEAEGVLNPASARGRDGQLAGPLRCLLGLADKRIGVARLELPEHLPE